MRRQGAARNYESNAGAGRELAEHSLHVLRGDRVPERRVAVRDDPPRHEGETRQALDVGRPGNDGLAEHRGRRRVCRACPTNRRRTGGAERRPVPERAVPRVPGAGRHGRRERPDGSAPVLRERRQRPARGRRAPQRRRRTRGPPGTRSATDHGGRRGSGPGREPGHGRRTANQVGALLGIALERLQRGARRYAVVRIPVSLTLWRVTVQVATADGHETTFAVAVHADTEENARMVAAATILAQALGRAPARPLPGRRATEDAAAPRDDRVAPDHRLAERQDDAPLGLRAGQVAARRVRPGQAPTAAPGGRSCGGVGTRGRPTPASRPPRPATRPGRRPATQPLRPRPGAPQRDAVEARASPRAPPAVTALQESSAVLGGAADATGTGVPRAARTADARALRPAQRRGTRAGPPARGPAAARPRPGHAAPRTPARAGARYAPHARRCARPRPPPPPSGRRSPDRPRPPPRRSRRRAAESHGQGTRTGARHGTRRSRQRAPARRSTGASAARQAPTRGSGGRTAATARHGPAAVAGGPGHRRPGLSARERSAAPPGRRGSRGPDPPRSSGTPMPARASSRPRTASLTGPA